MSTTATLHERLQAALDKVWKYTNELDEACAGMAECRAIAKEIQALSSERASIGPGLRVVLREYDQIAARLDGHPDGDEADFVMRAADYKIIRETLAKLPVEIVNPPKGWTP